jgi:hypothetical protein
MTGRSLHDGLLRVLTSARLRTWAAASDLNTLSAAVGLAEARVLCAADSARVRSLARFLGRHFYRERIVRLFAASRRVAQEAGHDPLDVLEGSAFATLLDGAELGSAATADEVATLVEGEVAGALAARPWGAALAAYEGALFRVEAGTRRWTTAAASATVVRVATARVLTLAWDVTGLVAAVRRGQSALPEPPAHPIRLLVALAPQGRVTTVRASEGIERVLAALDAPRTAAALARMLGSDEASCRRAIQQLVAIGAVEWRGA